MAPSSDLPEAASRRLAEGSFSSGLSVADFAACLSMGLEPLGLVQGFCAMQWGTYGGGILAGAMAPPAVAAGGYAEVYQCPHGFVSGEHRAWGQNYEQTWIEAAWRTGFSSALSRMVEEATTLDAHGVVGVVDTETPLVEAGIAEFHLRGTAVRVEGAPAPTGSPWTTFLAGQRLAKVFEAGYAPLGAVASTSSVRVWANCVTEYALEGTGGVWSGGGQVAEVDQVVRAHGVARELARSRVRSDLHGDALHGADLYVLTREHGPGDLEIQVRLKGNRVRRVAPFSPLPVPQLTVALS
ncbi:MAG TPA: hypothetical protein PLS29_06615 [Acidimicrobiales bacterium]|nr:MAG: hypothetical protein B7Z69_08190 [Actinobacteria bacterium 21-73-9]HQU26689.1 hypothetical protein [Acidimicrobiales bacterium]